MLNSQNPFSQFRAENMGADLWKLYVPGPFGGILTPRPLVLEGGRGSGKTMFFLYNSWPQQLLRLEANGKTIKDLVSPPEVIGLYYKVDTAFVTAMDGKGRNDWEGIFSTYLGVCIVKEALHFLDRAVREGLLSHAELQHAYDQLVSLLPQEVSVNTTQRALVVADGILDEIEWAINSPSGSLRFKPTVIGRIVSRFLEAVRSAPALEKVSFRVFIDEYETLLEPQQRLVNTLIKHSHAGLVYNVGLRPRGMLTQRTAGGSEVIQAPHDFNLFRPEAVLDPEEGDSQKTYDNLLREVCERRFQFLRNTLGSDSIPTDIEYYLGKYDIDAEIEEITQSRQKDEGKFRERLRNVIFDLEGDSERTRDFVRLLADEPDPLYARLHLCLLRRTGRYRPSVPDLANEYRAYLSGRSRTYRTWLHNTKLGLVFLLSREYRHPKSYYGLDVFTMLSSGVVRYFLELCEQSFEFASLKGFSWDRPRPITPDEQSRAARYVSRYKIRDIDGYEPYGRALRIFVQNIGDVFNALHTHPDTTLGEPEPNHFCTRDLALGEPTRKVINSAVMWAVLQERIPTKEKAPELPVETVDYHLNHIYCPYFEISYRQKRKLNVSPEHLEALLSGDEGAAQTAAKAILISKKKAPSEEEHHPKKSAQLTLFDGVDEIG